MAGKKSGVVLITGGTGLLGHALVGTNRGRHEVVAVHLREHRVENARARYGRVDLRAREEVAHLFRQFDVDVVIHTAGIGVVDYVERHPGEAWEANVKTTAHIAEACEARGARLVFISSNAVFDGTAAPYAEEAPTNPIHRYGAMKVECEKIVQGLGEACTIVRPILMYGWHLPCARMNPVTWLLGKLRGGEQVRLVTDVRENPLSSRWCAEAVWALVEAERSGIFHVAGRDTVSRYELGLAVAEIFSLDPEKIVPVGSPAFPELVLRPPNTSLSTEKLERELGLRTLGLREGLHGMSEQDPASGCRHPDGL
ncbi:MAG: SDR family oxidoreductase [Candidatus Rokubacteria bacterium]|nr:SDR family oxidoreductase [Candidatus Rokubacteria bacterium]